MTVALAPLDVRFGPSRILQPDLMVFLRPLPRDIETPITRVPELVIEVLSNNRSYDRFTKRALYAEAGVKEYWLVDIDGSRIEVRTGAALSGERFCTDKLSVIPLGERHLRQIVQQFVDHYHQERNHQSLDNKLIEPMNENAANSGRVVRRKRLGGVLNYYYREAA